MAHGTLEILDELRMIEPRGDDGNDWSHRWNCILFCCTIEYSLQMKRFWRNLLDFLTLVSLLAAIGMTVVWASRLLPRGLQIPLSLHFRSSARESVDMVAGFNYVYFERMEWHDNPIVGPPARNTAAADAFKQRYASQAIDRDIRRLALRRYRGPLFSVTSRGRVAMVGNSSTVGVGMGYFPLLFLLLPACRLPLVFRWAKKRYGRKPGCCKSCGYDLRASSDRCPECGASVDFSTASS